MTDEKPNPYIEMPADVLKVHLEQLKTVMDEKKLDVTQTFGTPITEADQVKIDEHASLTSQVQDLTGKINSASMTDVEVQLTQQNLDRVAGDIRTIDADAPIEAILGSKFNNLEKISILGNVKAITEHYVDQIAIIKKEIGSDSIKTGQTFSKPASVDSAESIIKGMYNLKDE